MKCFKCCRKKYSFEATFRHHANRDANYKQLLGLCQSHTCVEVLMFIVALDKNLLPSADLHRMFFRENSDREINVSYQAKLQARHHDFTVARGECLDMLKFLEPRSSIVPCSNIRDSRGSSVIYVRPCK